MVITGAALGLPGAERVFDDENIGRILDGQQFIDAHPARLRREMVDKHITRLVKREPAIPTFDTIDDEAEVVKLAGRGGPLSTWWTSSASTPPATPRWTRPPGWPSAPGFDALRDAGIPLVMRYKHHDARHPAARSLGAAGVAARRHGRHLRLRLPRARLFAHDLERYYTDRSTRASSWPRWRPCGRG